MAAGAIRRAAQYLRMSTEHQRYSLASQAATIATYAMAHGIEIVATYVDEGKSGVGIKTRLGLQKLLADTLGGRASFTEILVYDVSRWGRFQNPDQAAHYEFICQEAGFPVHYCAEQFANDGAPTSTILKQIKRVMAAEYSRELSVKVRAAHLLQARLGFSQGGPAPFGLRRQLLGADGAPKAILASGEHKALASDRVVWVTGPENELTIIRLIYDLYARRGLAIHQIALKLRSMTDSNLGVRWTYFKVQRILTSEIYKGVYVYARKTKPLGGPAQKVPSGEWIRYQMLPPVISERVWQAVQQRRAEHETRRSYSERDLLDRLAAILAKHGKLNTHLIETETDMPSLRTYYARFGTLFAAYQRIGYHPSRRANHRLGPNWDTRDAMLQHLRRIYAEHGYVSSNLINRDPNAPCAATYAIHFGGLIAAYRLAGLPSGFADLQAEKGLRLKHRLATPDFCPSRAIPRASVADVVAGGALPTEAARQFGISLPATYRLLRGASRYAWRRES